MSALNFRPRYWAGKLTVFFKKDVEAYIFDSAGLIGQQQQQLGINDQERRMQLSEQDPDTESSASTHQREIATTPKKLKLTLKEEQAEGLIEYLKVNSPTLANLNDLKSLIEQPNSNLSIEILIHALEVLPAKYNSQTYDTDTAIIFELHSRILVTLLHDIRCQLDTTSRTLSKQLREKIYENLTNFEHFHHLNTIAVSAGVWRNYNVDFYLAISRDILHCIPDNESIHTSCIAAEFTQLMNYGELSLLPSSTSRKNLLGDWEIDADAFNQQYKVCDWHLDWCRLYQPYRQLYEWISNVRKESAEIEMIKKYAEIQLFNELWLNANNVWAHDTSFAGDSCEFFSAGTNNQDDLFGSNPISHPNSLWFGILDIVHKVLIENEIQHPVNFILCYYLALRSLENSPSDFIRFKALEILLFFKCKYSDWTTAVDSDLKVYRQLNSDSLVMSQFDELVEAIQNKCKYELTIRDQTDQLSVKKAENKSNSKNPFRIKLPTNNKLSHHQILSKEITKHLMCPVSKKLTNEFTLYPCGHVLGSDSVEKPDNLFSNITCFKCSTKIKYKDLRTISVAAIIEGIEDRLTDTANSKLTENTSIINNNSNDSRRSSTMRNSSLFRVPRKLCSEQRKANEALMRRKWDLAIVHLNIVLEDYSTSYSTRCLRAKTLLRTHDYASAFEDLNIAIKQSPRRLEAFRIRGYAWGLLRHWDESMIDLHKALEIEKDNSDTLGVRGAIYGMMGKYEEALNDLTLSLKKEPDNAFSLRYRGWINFNLRNYDQALEDLQKSLTREPNNAFAIRHRGMVYHILRQYSNALSDFNKAIQFNEEDFVIMQLRGDTYMNLGYFNEALDNLNKVLDENSSNSFALHTRGTVLRLLRRHDEALLDLHKAVMLDPLNGVALRRRARCYQELEYYNEAFVDFESALSSDPTDIYALKERSELYCQIGDFQKAIEDLNAIVELDPNNVDGFKQRGLLYFQIGMQEEAKRDWERVKEFTNALKTLLRTA
ncbi:6233_t:CDS:2 [Ambispora gerdemannii]|uniref:6233_t:CDS:1 n=1 Tax=Ambispora gerdemannii TaxID=144530 RepID=A0A9N9AQG3_9GLOM|nr:6233_t:CDS:2 [Ambispora gerdemannii]